MQSGRAVPRLLALSLIFLGACGSGLSGWSDATPCASNVRVQPSRVMDCEEALAAVRGAEEATGTSLAKTRVLFVAGEDLRALGHEDAYGMTSGDGAAVAVVASSPTTLVHEALHVGGADASHCGWATDERLRLLERNLVPGSFTDACAGKVCSATASWTDATGKIYGYRWRCGVAVP